MNIQKRSGTLLEDMYWIDIDSAQVIASEIKQTGNGKIKYSRTTMRKIAKHNNLLTIHTHPESMPPSINDFNSAYKNQYQICMVCCHDGRIYMYQSSKHILEVTYLMTIAKYKKRNYGEFEAQLLALEEFQKNGHISFKEV